MAKYIQQLKLNDLNRLQASIFNLFYKEIKKYTETENYLKLHVNIARQRPNTHTSSEKLIKLYVMGHKTDVFCMQYG